MSVLRADPLVPVVFAADAATAQRYAAALAQAGIEAHVRIEDGAHFSRAGSAYGAISGEAFVYPVLVSRLQRRAARRALAGMTGSEPSSLSAGQVARVGAFVAGSVLLVAAAAWLRGDL